MTYGEITLVYDVVLVILCFSIVILCFLLLISCKKQKNSVQETKPPIGKPKLPASPHSFMAIDTATDGFKNNRVIGKGWIGTVYAGLMPTGELVAVKRIHPHLVFLSNNNSAAATGGGGFGFSSVMKWLSLADHPHLAQIIGYSEAPGERIIVMEFQGMMSLDFYLYHDDRSGLNSNLLDWNRRVKIAAGIARGIEYLHENMTPNIVHGRIKPSNILIDAKFNAKLCDYGLQFLVPAGKRKGMAGYVADDDEEENCGGGRSGGGSKESDVYGVGVVLLELLSGRRSSSTNGNGGGDEEKQGLIMVDWALPLIKQMKFNELLDRRLEIPTDIESVIRLSNVALACVANYRKNRPTISQVVAILNSIENRLTY